MSEKKRVLAIKLMTLAVNEGGSIEERRTAAMTAVQLIMDNNLMATGAIPSSVEARETWARPAKPPRNESPPQRAQQNNPFQGDPFAGFRHAADSFRGLDEIFEHFMRAQNRRRERATEPGAIPVDKSPHVSEDVFKNYVTADYPGADVRADHPPKTPKPSLYRVLTVGPVTEEDEYTVFYTRARQLSLVDVRKKRSVPTALIIVINKSFPTSIVVTLETAKEYGLTEDIGEEVR